MPSLGSLIHIAKNSIVTQQNAMNVVAHNLANASTPGYSRQRAVLNPTPALATDDGVFGTGVTIENVQRIRDELLDGVYYRELGAASQHDARSSMMTRVEGVLGEPSDSGLAASMDAFYSSWSDLASNPASATNRSSVRQAASVMTQRFHQLSSNLDAIRQETDNRLLVAADRVNSLTADIAKINSSIVSMEASGLTAGDLRDARATALAELSELVPVQVTERSNGSIGVNSSGFGLIDGSYNTQIEIRTVAGTAGVAIPGRPGLFQTQGGTIGGLLTVLNTDLPDAQSRLDQLAANLVTEVNALHQTTTTPAGNTGVDFFDPTLTTAGGIDLSAAVAGSLQEIGAGTPDGTGGYRAGANDVALSLGGLRDTTVAALGSTMNVHFQGLVSDVGQTVRSSQQAADVQRVLADQADVRRMSYSGVSVDEELVKMIEFQTVYSASARVITTADEMIQSLLSI